MHRTRSQDARTFAVSQNIVAAVCMPAPFFCMMVQVTIYLKGFSRDWSSFKHCSMMLLIQPSTLVCVYLPHVGVRGKENGQHTWSACGGAVAWMGGGFMPKPQ